MSSMKKAALLTAMAALVMNPGGTYSGHETYSRRRHKSAGKYKSKSNDLSNKFSFSAGHYKGAEFNKISRWRRRNKIARKSRRKR